MSRRILLCSFIDGKTVFSLDGLVLMLGVPNAAHLRERWDPATGMAGLPEDLQRKARKRVKAAHDATGDPTAAYEWGAAIEVDETTGQTWAVLDQGTPC